MSGPIFCNKNPTICISLELLNKVVSLSLPHLLANGSSPLGQLEVDKDIVPGEVVSSCHAFREQVPGRPRSSVGHTEDECVAVPGSDGVTGNHITRWDPDICLSQD